MYLVVIAWLYVTLMMAVAEATSSTGSVLGAVITFVLYGALPIALVVYLMRTPVRRRARQAREAREDAEAAEASGTARAAAAPSVEPDTGSETAAAATSLVTPVRKEP